MSFFDDDFLSAQFTDAVAHPFGAHGIGNQFDAVCAFLFEGDLDHFRIDMQAIDNHFRIDVILQERMSGHTRFTMMESPLRIEEMGDMRCLGFSQLAAKSIRMPDRKHDAVIETILFECRRISGLRRIGYQTDQAAAQVLPFAH